MQKKKLLGLTLNELSEITHSLNLPAYTARQVANWIYKKNVNDIALMSDIALKNRQLLSQHFQVGGYDPIGVASSVDGTKKYLFEVSNHRFIEAVYIPDDDRATLCVSSQAGCKMGCKFCMTARQGFNGQLMASDIINQVRSIPEYNKLTNIVFMGMGEPLDNIDEVLKAIEILTSDYGYGWAPKRITVSTIGVLPNLKRFLETSKCHLAISLHSPFPEERRKIMPIEQTYPIKQVLTELKKYQFNQHRRLSFEYIVFKGFNDTPRHVKELARLLNGLNCRINLIRFHQIPNSDLQAPDDNTINTFARQLNEKGIITTIRASRGQDIWAACGLLSTKAMEG